MQVQRYDVRDPDGRFVERHWQPVNTPLFVGHGDLIGLLHYVEDVTSEVLYKQPLRRAGQAND